LDYLSLNLLILSLIVLLLSFVVFFLFIFGIGFTFSFFISFFVFLENTNKTYVCDKTSRPRVIHILYAVVESSNQPSTTSTLKIEYSRRTNTIIIKRTRVQIRVLKNRFSISSRVRVLIRVIRY